MALYLVGRLGVRVTIGVCSCRRLSTTSHRLVSTTHRTAGHDCTPCSRFSMKTTTELTGNVMIANAGRRGTTCPSKLYTRHAALFCTGSRRPSRTIAALTVTTHGRRGRFLRSPVPPYNTYQRIVLRARGHFGRPVEILLCNGGKVCRLGGIKRLLPLSFSTSTVGWRGRWDAGVISTKDWFLTGAVLAS